MPAYVDTSALVKRYIEETDSRRVVDFITEMDVVGVNSLTKVEMTAAFTKSVRRRVMDRPEAIQTWEIFLGHWPSYLRLPVSADVIERACEVAWKYTLRGYDAIHLSSAVRWQETLGSSVTLATFDRELWIAGRSAGLAVWPEQLLYE